MSNIEKGSSAVPTILCLTAQSSPAGHAKHVPAPPVLYWPVGQMDVVADADPAGHAYPALHDPLHDAVPIAAVAPYKPAWQSTQVEAPARLYLPMAHWDAVADTDPAGHTYPAPHSPLHADDVSPPVAPYLPAGH